MTKPTGADAAGDPLQSQLWLLAAAATILVFVLPVTGKLLLVAAVLASVVMRPENKTFDKKLCQAYYKELVGENFRKEQQQQQREGEESEGIFGRLFRRMAQGVAETTIANRQLEYRFHDYMVCKVVQVFQPDVQSVPDPEPILVYLGVFGRWVNLYAIAKKLEPEDDAAGAAGLAGAVGGTN